MKRTLSRFTEAEIAKLVQMTARKIGYSSTTDDFYTRSDMKGVFSTLKKKPTTAGEQLSREMTDFIFDCIDKLMEKGASEEQALSIIKDNFSDEKMADSLNEFFKEYGGTKMERSRQYSGGVSKKEVLGMLYIAFAIIGLGFGAIVGTVLKIITIGIVSGIAIGVGCGIIAHAIILLESIKK